MSREFVHTRIEDGIFVLTVDRPEKLNAITVELERQWRHALLTADADPGVRVIVQHGTGRVFSAGHDLTEVGRIIAELGPDASDWQHVYDRIWPEGSCLDATQALSTPIISAVHGQVVGQCVFQVLACDLVVAAEATVFNLEVMRTGGAAGAAALLGLLPDKLVNEIAYLGRLGAEDLARVGAVNRVLPADEVLDGALGLARSIARLHRSSVAHYKRAFTAQLDAQGLARFAAGFADIRDSHGNDEDNEFWARAARDGVQKALLWRDAEFGPDGDQR